MEASQELIPRCFLGAITISTHLLLRLGTDPRVDRATMQPLGVDYVVNIEGAFTLSRGDTEVLPLTPRDPSGLGPLLGLRMTWLTGATQEQGVLRLVFEDGPVLVVPPLPAYEAWSVHGPDGRLTVCTPGGELVVFEGPRPD